MSRSGSTWHSVSTYSSRSVTKVATSCLAVTVLALLTACTQPVPRVDETSRAPLDRSGYETALRAGADVFRVDPAASQILVRVGRAGRMQRLGHDHSVASLDVQGLVALYADPERSHADLAFPLRNLVVDKAEHRDRLGLDTEPTPSDIAATYTNMLKVLGPDSHPWAAMRARIAANGSGATEMSVSISLNGTTAEFLVPTQLNVDGKGLRAAGSTRLSHADFSLEPYSAAGGLLRVADALEVHFTIIARRIDAL